MIIGTKQITNNSKKQPDMKTYRISILIVAVFAMIGLLFQSCKSSSDDIKDLNIEAITVGDADLNAATSPTNVDVKASIKVTFNTGIEAQTANESTIKMVQDYDKAQIPLSISVSGATLTVTPENPLGNGTLYEFSITSGLLSTDEQPLTAISRTFTTAGTFSPAGLVAHWTFEDSAEDVAGSYNPSANGIVDITYVDSRNAKAGKAASFNGNTSIIEIPNANTLIETDDFTLSFWVKANSDHVNENGDPAGHFVMGLAADYGFQYEIFGGYDGSKLAVRYEHAEGNNSEDMWFPAEATDNTNGGWQGWDYARSLSVEEMQAKLKDNWYHVTFTFDGSARKATLYFDGEKMKSFDFNLWPEEDAKRTVTGTTYAGEEPDFVNELAFGFIQSRGGTMWENEPWGGYDFPTANHFKGELDDVKIYHKVLTETEIQLMYDSEK